MANEESRSEEPKEGDVAQDMAKKRKMESSMIHELQEVAQKMSGLPCCYYLHLD